MNQDTPQKPSSAENQPKRASDQRGINRRQFTKASGATIGALAGFHFLPALAQKRLEKPTLGAIGIGGKGASDIAGARRAGFEVVALADIVDTRKYSNLSGRMKKTGQMREEYSQAKFFTDYREMLARHGDRIDAVTVSTPDHHHYHASAMAMNAGKHVYCQKPLTHSIWEARMLNEIAPTHRRQNADGQSGPCE